MAKELDTKDRQIIHLLSQNARRALTSLAKAINLSRSATQERLQRLEDSGAILGYTVRLGIADRKGIEVWLLVKLQPGVSCAQTVPVIQSFAGASEVYALAGDIDLIVHGRADSADAISDMRDEIAALATVADVRTYPVLAAY